MFSGILRYFGLFKLRYWTFGVWVGFGWICAGIGWTSGFGVVYLGVFCLLGLIVCLCGFWCFDFGFYLLACGTVACAFWVFGV